MALDVITTIATVDATIVTESVENTYMIDFRSSSSSTMTSASSTSSANSIDSITTTITNMHLTNTPRLPPELFRPILSHLALDRPTILSLALTTRFLRSESERVLYTSLAESYASQPSLHIAFLSTIIRTPRLAALVREYHSINIVHYDEAPLWGLTKTGLGKMTNLRILHFRSFGGHPSSELLLHLPAQLERLHWACHSEPQSTMSIVLEQQRELRYLYLEARKGTRFSEGVCPRLGKLAGNRVTLEALMPGRKVREVAWIPELSDSANFAGVGGGGQGHEGGVGERMEVALRDVRSLSFGGYFARPHLGLVVDYLQKLETLELVGLLSEEMMLIKRLKNLHELIFSFKWGSRHLPLPCSFSERQQLVEELFSWCPKLKRIDIAYEWTTIADIWYQRWTRDAVETPPIKVSLMEVKCGRFGGRAV